MALYYGNGTKMHLMMMADFYCILQEISWLKKFNNVLFKSNLPISNACSLILGLQWIH